MIRSVCGKLLWLGRATSAVVGLAVVLALVVGASSAALAGNLDPLKIGSVKNVATKTTALVGKVATGSAFAVKNPSGGSALGLQVNAGQAPLIVNSEAGKATNLDADKIDGRDSSAFAIRTDHSIALASDCDNPNTWNLCAPVTVTVPPGKTYYASVWSSFTAKAGINAQDVAFCSGGRGPGIDSGNPCITPWGIHSRVTIEPGQFGAASSSGETVPLSEGEYTFGTAISPAFDPFVPHDDARVITKVLVRDTANSF